MDSVTQARPVAALDTLDEAIADHDVYTVLNRVLARVEGLGQSGWGNVEFHLKQAADAAEEVEKDVFWRTQRAA